MTNILPKAEQFRYADQILRSSRSVAMNIAEGYGRKNYKKDFIKFLTYAKASADKTRAHLSMIYTSGFIKYLIFCDLDKRYKDISIRIENFIKAIEINDLNILKK